MKITALLLFGLLLLILPQQTFAEDTADTVPGITVEPSMHYTMEHNNMQPHVANTMMDKGKISDTMKQNHAAMQGQIQQARDAFKTKLATIKDARKKTVADALNTKLNTINKDRTDRMTANLTKLNDILSRLEAKKIEAQTNGKDVTAINADIVTAEQTITAAQTAVTAQAAKDYTPQITSEQTLRQNFNTVFTQMKTDLETTQKTVVSAKEAVRTVAKAIELVQGTPEITVSPTP